MIALLLVAIMGLIPPKVATRPFLMGFTKWPSDLTVDGLRTTEAYANAHGDIVSVMFIGGIPWQEALDRRPYSRDVEEQLSYRPPQGKRLFLSISPLDEGRDGLAPYWGEHDNLPLPSDWASCRFDSPQAVTAYTNFVLDAVARMHPDYCAIAIEANDLLTKRPDEWTQFKRLYLYTYRAVKRAHPLLPVFFTTDMSHYLGFAQGSDARFQRARVADLMRSSDLFAMSFYPFMGYSGPRPFSASLLDCARAFGKPIAVSESGMTSQDVTLPTYGVTLRGSYLDQVAFERRLLAVAAASRYRFVINFATTDFDALCAKLPRSAAELASIWEYTGMQTGAKRRKPAASVWDQVFRLPYKP
jgi:hypothetical protein